MVQVKEYSMHLLLRLTIWSIVNGRSPSVARFDNRTKVAVFVIKFIDRLAHLDKWCAV